MYRNDKQTNSIIEILRVWVALVHNRIGYVFIYKEKNRKWTSVDKNYFKKDYKKWIFYTQTVFIRSNKCKHI